MITTAGSSCQPCTECSRCRGRLTHSEGSWACGHNPSAKGNLEGEGLFTTSVMFNCL